MGCGFITSELEPSKDNRYTWYQPSTGKTYELIDDEWVENAHIVNGLSGTRVVGGYRLTFSNGLLTGFEPA